MGECLHLGGAWITEISVKTIQGNGAVYLACALTAGNHGVHCFFLLFQNDLNGGRWKLFVYIIGWICSQ